MRHFLNATGKLWMNGILVGKFGSRDPSENELPGARF